MLAIEDGGTFDFYAIPDLRKPRARVGIVSVTAGLVGHTAMKHYRVVTTKDTNPQAVDADRYDCRAPGYLCFLQGEQEVKLFSLANVVSWEETEPATPTQGLTDSFQTLYSRQQSSEHEVKRPAR